MRAIPLECSQGPTDASGGLNPRWLPPQPESALHQIEPFEPGPGPHPARPENRGWTGRQPLEDPAEPDPMGFLRNLEQRSQALTPTLLGILRNAEGHPYPRGGINE